MSGRSTTAGGLDLHGYTAAEAIERFVEQYNARVKHSQFGCWTIIHGYGSSGEGGVIRTRLRGLLDSHQDKLRYEPGDNYGNPGWTWVYPKVHLPDRRERLALEILSFCSVPKSEEKIVGKFVGVVGPQVKEILCSLIQQARLKSIGIGTKTRFQSSGMTPDDSSRNC